MNRLRREVGALSHENHRLRGDRIFWLEYVDAEGYALNVWMGADYAEALKEAVDCLTPGMSFVDLYADEFGDEAG